MIVIQNSKVLLFVFENADFSELLLGALRPALEPVLDALGLLDHLGMVQQHLVLRRQRDPLGLVQVRANQLAVEGVFLVAQSPNALGDGDVGPGQL